MSELAKSSIVLVHGLWADVSSFNRIIPTLLDEGYEVFAPQFGLDWLASDVEAVRRSFSRVPSPILLVGHSYGGTIITAAGVDDRVAGLVYIAGLAPDADETSQSLQDEFPLTDLLKTNQVEVCGRAALDEARSGRVFCDRAVGRQTKGALGYTCRASRYHDPEGPGHGVENQAKLVRAGQRRPGRASRAPAFCRAPDGGDHL